ncbi:MAG: type II secretion system protein [Sedimentisphaerales bacterium]|nr:type II secretion system protein [Sedimentisphaerales bacterium]
MDGLCSHDPPISARRHAFTLVELLVVIAIISLLLSVMIPSLRRARSSALRVACAHNLRQIGLGIGMYLGDHDGVYPCAQDPVDPNYWLWMGRGWRQWVEPYVGGSIGVRNPAVLLCPEDRTDPGRYESTSYAYSMAFYHSPVQIDAMSEPADTYDPTRVQRSIPQRASSVAHPAAKILIGEWLSNHAPVHDDQGWWCWLGSRTFLLADGQVCFLEATEIRPARDKLPDANLTVNGVKGRDLAR